MVPISHINNILHIRYPNNNVAVFQNSYILERRYENGMFTEDVYLATTDGTQSMNIRVRDNDIIEAYPTVDISEFPVTCTHTPGFTPYVSQDWQTGTYTHCYVVTHAQFILADKAIARFNHEGLDRYYGWVQSDEMKAHYPSYFADSNVLYGCFYFSPEGDGPQAALLGYLEHTS